MKYEYNAYCDEIIFFGHFSDTFWTNRQTDRQTDRPTDRQTDRQTDIVVYREVTLPKIAANKNSGVSV